MRGSLKEKVDSPPDPGLCVVALQGHVLHRQTTPSHTQDHPTVASDGVISPTSSMAENVISKKAHRTGENGCEVVWTSLWERGGQKIVHSWHN